MPKTLQKEQCWPGALVTLPVRRSEKPLDGFWRTTGRRKHALLIFVHGMHSNFYGSAMKKEVLRRCAREPFDVLVFNNRGTGDGTNEETFADCLYDIDAALAFGMRRGYRRFFLVGHSTGCQKITYYQSRRRDPTIAALVQLAPCDDLAIARRDLGRRYPGALKRAQALVAEGRGETILPHDKFPFTARRFLSVADPTSTEARLFDYDGPMKAFRGIRTPMFVLFGTAEEYACRPVEAMVEILQSKTRSVSFGAAVIPGADHGYHGYERQAVTILFRWLRGRTA